MNSTASDHNRVPNERQSMRKYSGGQTMVNNLPYTAMIVLGTIALIVALDKSTWGWITGTLYFIYGIVGVFWIIIFLCPYCVYCGTRSCPCGYGTIAGKLREKRPGNRFGEKFKKHVPVIVPLWVIPILAGVPLVIRSFSWPLLVLLVVFGVDAFVILPLFSTKHGCKKCPQRDSCPWMGRKGKPASARQTTAS